MELGVKKKVRSVNSFVRSSCTNKSELRPEYSLTKDDKHMAELWQLVIFLYRPKNFIILTGCSDRVVPELRRKHSSYRRWLARASSSCASLVSPLVTKIVHPDRSVSTEETDRTFQLLSIHLAPCNKRLCHPLLIYCPPPFSCAVHSAGNCSIIFARIPWPESVIQDPRWCRPKPE